MMRQNQHIDFTDLQDTDLHPEPETSPQPQQEAPKFRIKELLDGTILVRENMIRQLPYVLFLTVLGVIYIGNRFHAERMVRQISELKTEVSNLRAEQITTTSELMNISRPSEVVALVQSRNLGLKESLVPPKKLRRR